MQTGTRIPNITFGEQKKIDRKIGWIAFFAKGFTKLVGATPWVGPALGYTLEVGVDKAVTFVSDATDILGKAVRLEHQSINKKIGQISQSHSEYKTEIGNQIYNIVTDPGFKDSQRIQYLALLGKLFGESNQQTDAQIKALDQKSSTLSSEFKSGIASIGQKFSQLSAMVEKNEADTTTLKSIVVTIETELLNVFKNQEEVKSVCNILFQKITEVNIQGFERDKKIAIAYQQLQVLQKDPVANKQAIVELSNKIEKVKKLVQQDRETFDQKLLFMHSGVQICAFLAEFSGNYKLAKQITVVGQAAVSITQGVSALLGFGTMAAASGPLAPIMVIGGGISAIVQLFSGQKADPNEVILTQIATLSQQVDQLVDQLARRADQRFDRIDRELDSIYQTMIAGFRTLHREQKNIISRLQKLESASQRFLENANHITYRIILQNVNLREGFSGLHKYHISRLCEKTLTDIKTFNFKGTEGASTYRNLFTELSAEIKHLFEPTLTGENINVTDFISVGSSLHSYPDISDLSDNINLLKNYAMKGLKISDIPALPHIIQWISCVYTLMPLISKYYRDNLQKNISDGEINELQYVQKLGNSIIRFSKVMQQEANQLFENYKASILNLHQEVINYMHLREQEMSKLIKEQSEESYKKVLTKFAVTELIRFGVCDKWFQPYRYLCPDLGEIDEVRREKPFLIPVISWALKSSSVTGPFIWRELGYIDSIKYNNERYLKAWYFRNFKDEDIAKYKNDALQEYQLAQALQFQEQVKSCMEEFNSFTEDYNFTYFEEIKLPSKSLYSHFMYFFPQSASQVKPSLMLPFYSSDFIKIPSTAILAELVGLGKVKYYYDIGLSSKDFKVGIFFAYNNGEEELLSSFVSHSFDLPNYYSLEEKIWWFWMGGIYADDETTGFNLMTPQAEKKEQVIASWPKLNAHTGHARDSSDFQVEEHNLQNLGKLEKLVEVRKKLLRQELNEDVKSFMLDNTSIIGNAVHQFDAQFKLLNNSLLLFVTEQSELNELMPEILNRNELLNWLGHYQGDNQYLPDILNKSIDGINEMQKFIQYNISTKNPQGISTLISSTVEDLEQFISIMSKNKVKTISTQLGENPVSGSSDDVFFKTLNKLTKTICDLVLKNQTTSEKIAPSHTEVCAKLLAFKSKNNEFNDNFSLFINDANIRLQLADKITQRYLQTASPDNSTFRMEHIIGGFQIWRDKDKPKNWKSENKNALINKLGARQSDKKEESEKVVFIRKPF